MTNPPAQPILRATNIVKTFPGVRALDGVNLEIVPGEVHAVVGENGAGKSTLMHILGGVLRPDAGQILIAGKPTSIASPHDAARQGISVVFQELSLVPGLSIAENIFAHRQPVTRLNTIRWKVLYNETRALLDLFELRLDPALLVRDLPVAQQQVIEILKAVSQRPRVLILDEPTSSLTGIEVKHLFRNIRALKEQGLAFIYISHHLPEVFSLCDRVTVLRDGRHVETRSLSDTTEGDLIRLMVGRELTNIYGQRTSNPGEPYFQLENAGRGKSFQEISLTLRKGEIVGLAGLVGAGRTELGRGISGVEPITSGQITLDGKPVRIRRPAQAIANGIAYLTEDRKQEGLFLRMPIRDNCAAPSLGSFTRVGMLSDSRISRFAEESRKRFRVATPDIEQKVVNLSGGNQQKILLAMWMGTRPKVLIVDEPTRGVDVGAKSEIYELLRQLAETGVGILMISSDILEILGVSDRILVLREGRIAGEFSRDNATEENIIACASGVVLN